MHWFQNRPNTSIFPSSKHKHPGTQYYLFPSDVPAGFPAGCDVFLPDFQSSVHLFQPFLTILRHLHFASTRMGFWVRPLLNIVIGCIGTKTQHAAKLRIPCLPADLIQYPPYQSLILPFADHTNPTGKTKHLVNPKTNSNGLNKLEYIRKDIWATTWL